MGLGPVGFLCGESLLGGEEDSAEPLAYGEGGVSKSLLTAS